MVAGDLFGLQGLPAMKQTFQLRTPLKMRTFNCADIKRGSCYLKLVRNLHQSAGQFLQIMSTDIDLGAAGGHFNNRQVNIGYLF